MTNRIVVGLLGALLLGGCSAGPSSAPVETTAQSEQAASVTPPVSPGQYLLPGGPAAQPTNFDECELRTEDGTVIVAEPHFVVRLPDPEGQPYGFNDGYSLPFPTPWIHAPNGGACNPPPGVDCVDDEYVWDYEHALVNVVPGIVNHQFLVYDLASDGKGYTVGDSQWFYNGTTDMNALPEMTSVVQAYKTKPGVDPARIPCVYVMQALPDGQHVAYTGFHAQVAQSHDPINWPDIRF